MSKTNVSVFGYQGDREVLRLERDGDVTYLAFLISGSRSFPQGRFAWSSGEEDQVRAWLAGGPDPK